MLIKVMDFHIVQNDRSFFVLALVDALLIWTHEGHLKVTFSGLVKGFFANRRPLTLQVVVDIEAFPKSCNRWMLLLSHEAWLWPLESCFENDRTIGSRKVTFNFEEMMWRLTYLACKDDSIFLHSMVFCVGQIYARSGTIGLWIAFHNLWLLDCIS